MEPVPMNEVLDAILIHLNKNRGFSVNTDDLHLATSMQVGDFFLNFRDILKLLVKNELIKENIFQISASTLGYSYEIEPKGTIFLQEGGYVKQAKDKVEIDRLNKEKLMVDISNAENIYKSYPRTKWIAWISLAIGLSLLFLEVARALSIWPFHKQETHSPKNPVQNS